MILRAIYKISLVMLFAISGYSNSINIDSVQQSYIDMGYLDCQVTNGDSMVVAKGDRYSIDKIIILPSDTIEFTKRIYFEKHTFLNEIHKLIEPEIAKGYLYNRLNPVSIEKHAGKVTIILSPNLGPRPELEQIQFEGLVHTNEQYLRNYFSDDSVSFITSERVRKLEREVANVNYITYIPPIKVSTKEGYTKADLILKVKDKRLFSIDGSIGYLSDQKELLWMGDLTLQNLFGKGKRVDIFSQKVNSENQNLSIRYWQPMFLFGVGDFAASVATRDYRSQFYEFSLTSSSTFRVQQNLTIGARGEYKSVEPETEIGSFSVLSATFLADYTNAYSSIAENNQYRLSWELTYAARRSRPTDSLIPLDIAYDDTRIQIGVGYKLPIIKKLSLYNKIQYKGFETMDALPPLSELYLIGGEQTLRGFRDEQFAAIRTVLAKSELHLNFDSGYFLTFFDAAYIYNRISENNQIIDDEYYRFGYGIGFSIENEGSESVIIRVE